ncbi:MaoC/PaaZ C-terminal domain-containing protein [Mycobacterium sp. M23085]|uniref:MaoC/PaaZ C-terminal domain-containing protein n=1 Tax=Mycobacterium sp. M23085 TaxID=3378087 RepID=UPI003877B00A
MTASKKLSFDDTGLDIWCEEERFVVERQRLIDYAEATNDPIATHRSGEVAAPVFAIVPVFEAMLMPAIDVVPIELIPKVVHGEQDFRFHRAIRPGDILVSRAKMIGYEGLDNGTRAAIFVECRTEAGELVNEQYVTCFIRNFDAGTTVGELSPGHKFDEHLREQPVVATVTQHVDDDQTFRYSPASGDPMPIHLDEEVARDAGLPGIIAHGLCTMAFASWAVLTEVADSDVTRLRRLAVRFSKMVLPGDDLQTRIWRDGSRDGVTTYRFETTRVGTAGEKAITDGWADIDDETKE